MTSLILSTAARFLLPLLLLFSMFVLLRGHNEPGGGFIGGLIAAAAFAFNAIASDVKTTRRTLHLDPRTLIPTGLTIALASGIIALFFGRPFMAGKWVTVYIPGLEELDVGTPLLFDCGVYLSGPRRDPDDHSHAGGGVAMETVLAFVIGGALCSRVVHDAAAQHVKLIIGISLLGHAANLLIFTIAGLTRGAAAAAFTGASPTAWGVSPIPCRRR